MKTRFKRHLPVILLAAFIMLISESCSKYPDGPMLSLRTRTERVSNTWKIDNYKVNGNDYTSLLSGYTETFSKDGNYSYSWGSLSGTGTWAFQTNDKEIKLTGVSNQSTYTLVILKLEEKQFWYYYMDGNDKKEFHMVQN
ncbi:MAG: hypothetical protein RL007_878 [Bacteroidota bacterium]|jgi:hypothetical protein